MVRTIFPGEVEQMMDSFGEREKNDVGTGGALCTVKFI